MTLQFAEEQLDPAVARAPAAKGAAAPSGARRISPSYTPYDRLLGAVRERVALEAAQARDARRQAAAGGGGAARPSARPAALSADSAESEEDSETAEESDASDDLGWEWQVGWGRWAA
jgi:hypothetical protein